ncbi:uncharacterized protein [Ptychodera flava]|uniref:uncharacterized protein n=1 Tax=Ptychodera flava TaxID=63121 RepID=UPI00396A032B
MSDKAVAAQNVTSSSKRASTLNRRKKLYDDLNNKLGREEEDKLKHLLGDNQLEKRELEDLKNVAGILNKLDEKGEFDDSFQLLKDLLLQIQRKPLIKLVEQCEKTWQVHQVHKMNRLTAKTSCHIHRLFLIRSTCSDYRSYGMQSHFT